MIKLQNVTKIYKSKKGKETTVLNNVSFILPKMGMICILGASGSGKTTLLNILGLLDKPTSGQVLFNNENIYKFNEKKITNYRSSEIGFIFQEFNLFEELNVYDNVGLSLDLHDDKDNHQKIMRALSFVQLEDFAKREINELSGGEKQRVAIARAIVKNPQVILADEPTGNLDSNNSRIVFEKLKEISRTCLVVLVTHDRKSAQQYADRIIELSDGKIISYEESYCIDDENINIRKNQFHISFIKKLKFAFGLLHHKKIRLFLTVIILSIAFSLLEISLNIQKFNVPKMHAETMIKENNTKVQVRKVGNNFANITNKMFDKDLNIIEKDIGDDYSKYSILLSYNLIYDFKDSVLNNDAQIFNDEYYNNAYYKSLDSYDSDTFFKSLNEKELKNLNIIGEIPNQPYEILIPEIIADYLVVHGFNEPQYNEQFKTYFGEEKFVDDINELLNQKLYVMGDKYLIIKGIIKDENLEKFESLKQKRYDKLKQEPTDLYKEFINTYLNDSLYILVVNNNFWETSEFMYNRTLVPEIFPNVIKTNDSEIYDNYTINLTTVIKNENIDITLNEGEIYLSKDLIYQLYRKEINAELDKRINSAILEYEKQLEQREHLISEYKKKCLEFGECDYTIPDIEYVDNQKIENEVYDYIVKEKNLIGNNISLLLKDVNDFFPDEEEKTYELKVIGYGNSTYINLNQFQKYMVPNELIDHLDYEINDAVRLENIFEKYENNNKYEVKTDFSETMKSVSNVVDSIEKISIYIAIVFLAFAIILFILFITNNISNNKKKVGILRALGTKIIDIVKIFMLESAFITCVTFILSNVLSILSIIVLNSFIANEVNFSIMALSYNLNTLGIVFILEILIMIVSLIFPIIYLSKLKPIKLINNN